MSVRDWDWTGGDTRSDAQRLWTGLRDGSFLGAEQGVRKRGLVSVNSGWLARGGLLRLLDDRLEFEPNPLERLLGARHRIFAFDDITLIERRPANPGEMDPTGKTARMRIHMNGRSVDVIPAGGSLDAWLTAIRQELLLWVRRGPRDG